MAKKLYEEANIQAIAAAIRAKNGLTTTYTVSEMAAAILALSTGGGESSNVIFPPTGIWEFSKVLETANSYSMGSCEFSGDLFIGQCTAANTGAGIYSKAKIDLTEANALVVTFTATGITSGQSQFSLYVRDAISTSVTDEPIDHVATADELAAGVITIDVSAITGSYYIILGVCTWSSSRPGITISEIRLE